MSKENKDLCLRLIHCDSEAAVEQTLKEANYWDNPLCWRDLGDMENNYSTAGAQQSCPVAALVEKLVNSADAILMNACRAVGIDPEGDEAPPSPRHAVAQLIQKSSNPEREDNGLIAEMIPKQRSDLAKKITVAATGEKKRPSITIVDEGEGQTPANMPSTFLSLNKSNKQKIKFVQGRFNMGGTGALRFCGEQGIQLIVTRRNPQILKNPGDDDRLWGFTVVRKDRPRSCEKNSVYRYLAPIGADESRRGDVLRFQAETLKVRPDTTREKAEPYENGLHHGSLIKLYDYKLLKTSNIFMGHNLWRQAEVRLPSPVLPMMFYECRSRFSGKPHQTLLGVSTRFSDSREDSRADSLADGFPRGRTMTVNGEEFTIRFFGLKQSKTAENYFTKSDGVLFVLNGQTQGNLSARFYTRKDVGLGYISDSLLTIVDCSRISSKAQEDLFMNTREGLAQSEFRNQVERELEKRIKDSPALKAFNSTRRDEAMKAKIEDQKPMADLLDKVMRNSPTLSKLFLSGDKLKDPTNTAFVGPPKHFDGQEFPTYFHFKKRKPGDVLVRNCEKGRKVPFFFETDAEDNYFGRPSVRGSYKVTAVDENGNPIDIDKHGMELDQGISTLEMTLPQHLEVGQKLTITVSVTDDSRIHPFENQIKATMVPFVPQENRPSPRPIRSSGLSLPEPRWVKKENWRSHEFNEHSALRVVHSNTGSVYDFFINADNIHLKNELGQARGKEEIVRRQYGIGMTLIGLALIHDDEMKGKEASDAEKTQEDSIEERVAYVTRAVSMMVIPMMNLGLDNLKDSEIEQAA